MPVDSGHRLRVVALGLPDVTLELLSLALAQPAEAVTQLPEPTVGEAIVAVVAGDDAAEQAERWSGDVGRRVVAMASPAEERSRAPHVTYVGTDAQPQLLSETVRLALAAVEAERDAWVFNCFMRSAPELIFVKDKASRFLRCSERWTELFAGGAPYVGRTDSDFFNGAARSFELEQRIIRDRQADLRLTCHGDTEEAGGQLSSRAPLIDAHGQVVGTLGIQTELNPVLHLQQDIAQSDTLLNALLDQLPDKIFFKDVQGRYIRCSRSLALQVGAEDASHLIGKSDADLFSAAYAEQTRSDEEQVMQTLKVLTNKLEQEKHRDGRTTWSLTSKMPVIDHEGRVIGTLGVSKDITQLKHAEHELEKLNEQLMETSRQAGMAEVATGVLHNVGNVLNSVNVSASMVMRRVRDYQVHNLRRVAEMLGEHDEDLPEFLSSDERGQRLPQFMAQLAEHMERSETDLLNEVKALSRNIDHIKEIVATQQSYARTGGTIELTSVVDVIEDAIRINSAALEREAIELVREFQEIEHVELDRPKVLQILVNLLSNARHAVRGNPPGKREVLVRVRTVRPDRGPFVEIQVTDNGVGIPRKNLRRIFSHGFTTRADGHGFGLHSGAVAARAMGGRLLADSEGVGAGATFTLILPMQLTGVTS